MSNLEKMPKIPYAADEICPACGAYSVDGNVCNDCKKAFGIAEPRKFYTEDTVDYTFVPEEFVDTVEFATDFKLLGST